ncbi:hypothetical protein [Pseudovibrio sp. JE062]|uniref:hypothetical protein n=1 Tax=Pseudovibrio sp. JE062 TaxID=439495 RepID=UPI000186F5ED|nr:hypothetical protein [Pseudovibrio sp. JE062]EEA93339.1 conserved hypothetical protein [Pseudovibrio sp. JE062]
MEFFFQQPLSRKPEFIQQAKQSTRVHSVFAISAVFAFSCFASPEEAKSQETNSSTCADQIVVAATVQPPCLDGAARGITLAAARAYIWNTFIALNWPADASERGAPNLSADFGGPGPTVWETMRSKSEVYPGNASAKIPPHGVTLDPDGIPSNKPDYGYSQAPAYFFDPKSVGTDNGEVAACDGQKPVDTPALINLDETTQIGNNQIYAGHLPATDPSGYNSSPQLIRFSVKMNKSVYTNMVENRFWYPSNDDGTPSPLEIAQDNYTTALESGQGQNPQKPYVNFAPTPENNRDTAIELKLAFRPLTDTEKGSGRFYMTNVRYYETTGTGADAKPCYREDTWGLTGMHVLVFPEQAPWGIWATFEQADNILSKDGKAIENENGEVIDPHNLPVEATSPKLVKDEIASIKLPVIKRDGSYCHTPGNRLFLRENPTYKFKDPVFKKIDFYPTLPSDGNICVNRRWYAIPSDVIEANQGAHYEIETYLDLKHSGELPAKSPLLYYKLINVQPQPVHKAGMDDGIFSTTASYYLSDSTVETDYSLANFDGFLEEGVPVAKSILNKPLYNTQLLPFQAQRLGFGKINMGGCAGCHASAAQDGRDFSFALGSNAKAPEAVDAFTVPDGFINYFKSLTFIEKNIQE